MKRLLVFVVFLLFFPFCAAAAAEKEETVSRIVISGIMRIEPETVLTYLMIRKGDIVSDEQLDRGLKSLFSTGLFADVRLSVTDGVLNVDLVENPIVNQISFEGNKKSKPNSLKTNCLCIRVLSLHVPKLAGIHSGL